MPSNKSPGPDGYTAKFYKVSWPVIGKDFVVVVQSFLVFGLMPKSVNATSFFLVPKTMEANNMSDFWPIACCNLMYKVISKLIANMLKVSLPHAIESNQCVFVNGRYLLENVLLATELVKDYHKISITNRSAITGHIQDF